MGSRSCKYPFCVHRELGQADRGIDLGIWDSADESGVF